MKTLREKEKMLGYQHFLLFPLRFHMKTLCVIFPRVVKRRLSAVKGVNSQMNEISVLISRLEKKRTVLI